MSLSLGPKPYLLKPKNAVEAVYGKAVLLTDAMIAQMLDALKAAKAKTKEGESALDDLWRKLYELWNEDPPYKDQA